MKTRNTAACLGILTACFAISNAAIAEDNCSGHSVGVGSARVVTMDDHNLPMHLAIGYCRETGKTSGQCTFSDKDHDEWTDAQEWHGTGTEGTWYTVSGTGKYEKAKGSSGWWKLVRSDGTVSIWAIGGNCKLVGQTQ
jgi:hypothetical protein